MRYEPRIFANMFDYARRLTNDLTDADLVAQPHPGMNPPIWILGHLAATADFLVELLGGERRCPKSWQEAFSPKSVPLAEGSPRPNKGELLNMLEDRHAAVAKLLASGPIAQHKLDAPNPIEFARPMLPTVGDLLTHLLTSHPAVHLGQLSAWRRAVGKPAV